MYNDDKPYALVLVVFRDVVVTAVYLIGIGLIEQLRPLFSNGSFPLDAQITLTLWSLIFILTQVNILIRVLKSIWRESKALFKEVVGSASVNPNQERSVPSSATTNDLSGEELATSEKEQISDTGAIKSDRKN